jgi:hypothetical protein
MKDALLFALTAECIANPLKPPHFAAYNWIGYIRNGKLSAAGDGFFRPNLHQQAEFRAEFNQGLLRIINLSNEHIQALVLEYFHDETAQKAYQLLCSRRDTLKTLLEQDDSFRLYKQSAEARADQQHFKAHLEQFATNGVLLSSCVENIPLTQLKQDGLKLISRVKQHRVNRNDSAAQQKLQALSIAINSSESLKELETIKKQLTLDLQASLPDKVIAGKDCCFNLIREIKRYSVNNSDTALKTYLEGIEDQCQAARTIKQLAEIQTSLNDKLSTVKLEEVLAYKQTCLQLISEIQAYDNQHALSEDLDGMYTKIQQSHETKELKTIQNELTVQLIELEYNSAYARCLALFVDVHILHDAEDTPLHNVIEQIDQELPVVGTIQRLAAIEAQLTNILATIHSEKFIAAKQQLNNDNSDDAPNKHPT